MPAHTSRIETDHGSSDPSGPGLRADARHNRHRIVAAAGEAFAERGIDVPMAAIARRAGVGIATLYRRFPTREALVTEVFADQMAVCTSVLDEALADPDPWHGFCFAIEKVCEMQAMDRGFTSVFLSVFPGAVSFEDQRARAEGGLAEVIRRAKEAGRLRPDFAQEDLTLLLLANSGITTDSERTTAAASRRFVAYLLQSFERDDRAGALPPAPPIDLRQVYRLPTD